LSLFLSKLITSCNAKTRRRHSLASYSQMDDFFQGCANRLFPVQVSYFFLLGAIFFLVIEVSNLPFSFEGGLSPRNFCFSPMQSNSPLFLSQRRFLFLDDRRPLIFLEAALLGYPANFTLFLTYPRPVLPFSFFFKTGFFLSGEER